MKVLIKTWKQLKRDASYDRHTQLITSSDGDTYFSKRMKPLCGTIVTLNRSNITLLNAESWIIEPWMIQQEIHKCHEEIIYPIYMEEIVDGAIVKFTALTTGNVIKSGKVLKIKHMTSNWVEHTNKDIWKPADMSLIDTDRDLYHKQPIVVWDHTSTHVRSLRFYEARTKKSFSSTGRGGSQSIPWDNYEALVNVPDWMVEAQKTLKD